MDEQLAGRSGGEWAGVLAQWVKALATEPDGLS